MKKIIVPCDFSKPALEAIRFAADIARRNKGEVTFFHTIALPTMYDSSLILAFERDYTEELRNDALSQLEKVKSKHIGANVKVKTQVEFGDLLFQLKQQLKSGKYDLVVMGTHGASGLKEYTIGSNAEKIVRNSTVPVICVKKAPAEIKNIIFPVRPEVDPETLVTGVKKLQDFFDAKLHVVFINTPSFFESDSKTIPYMEKFAKRFALTNCSFSVFNDASESQGIINFCKRHKGDMVVMRTHGRRGLAHLAAGSIAEDVVNHIECPIWTLKIK